MPLARMAWRRSSRWYAFTVLYVPYMSDVERAVRRRGATLENAILRAAADELTHAGYAALSMDRVARRAGTNKNAIYRRWPNRLALGLAAYRLLARSAPLPDTGNLRED